MFEPYKFRAFGPNGHLAVDEACHRVTVVLGANGTGKTRLMINTVHAQNQKFPGKNVTYIEGARNFGDLVNVGVGADFARLHALPGEQREAYRGQRSVQFSIRVTNALKALNITQVANRIVHADEVMRWREDQALPFPAAPRAPLTEVIELFQSVFPRITLEKSANDQIYCRKDGGQQYSIGSASDGEKLVFALFAECIANDQDNVIFVVDEPEAHLNPLLACRVWDLLEQKLPQCQFIYATHCPSFAMRASVGSLFCLDDQGTLTRVSSFSEVPEREAEQFLGALPLVVNYKRALAVEGTELSFDKRFYPWLLGREDVVVVPLGGSTDVRGETSKLGLWKAIAPQAKILGVIDRDAGKLSSPTPSMHMLEFNEAESYLCHPQVAAYVAVAVSGGAFADHVKTISDAIVSHAVDSRLLMINQLLGGDLDFVVNITLSASAAKKMQDDAQLKTAVAKAAENFTKAASLNVSPLRIEKTFLAARDTVDQAISTRDIEKLLQLLPGKTLLGVILSVLGLTSVEVYLRCCATHIDPTKVPALEKLRQAILNAIL